MISCFYSLDFDASFWSFVIFYWYSLCISSILALYFLYASTYSFRFVISIFLEFKSSFSWLIFFNWSLHFPTYDSSSLILLSLFASYFYLSSLEILSLTSYNLYPCSEDYTFFLISLYWRDFSCSCFSLSWSFFILLAEKSA